MDRGYNIVREGTKIIPKKKKCKKAKCLSEEALQITEKRREVKGKGERERYTHLNAEFQSKMPRATAIRRQCEDAAQSPRKPKGAETESRNRMTNH